MTSPNLPPHSNAETPISFTMFVPWKSPSLNRTLNKHWTTNYQHKQQAKLAWLFALEGYEKSYSTLTILREALSPFGTSLRKALELTTTTRE